MALALLLSAGGLAASAEAGDGLYDRVHADSFGNLVIHSRAGYKRIIVGAGHLAGELSQYERTGDEDVVYLDEDEELHRHCYRPPVFIKGRSYMYGLADGEMPDLWGGCR